MCHGVACPSVFIAQFYGQAFTALQLYLWSHCTWKLLTCLHRMTSDGHGQYINRLADIPWRTSILGIGPVLSVTDIFFRKKGPKIQAVVAISSQYFFKFPFFSFFLFHFFFFFWKFHLGGQAGGQDIFLGGGLPPPLPPRWLRHCV